ncbi:carbonyl reductase [Loigolactobacillus backii]|uniref:SDR family oxidoreductase n=1 Tax=Loigolactobacillus backii TaxID=375175 RepID=UPI000C1CB00A|nr:SDR family oxidoreductase [Loigolactobacillus backii]PIO84154.1 carbonyl reductase [Loigolactobacillus backii]
MAETQETITLITGADKGVGFETAKELGQKGQRVIVGSRNVERGHDAIGQLAAAGVKADLVQLDVTDKASIKAAADTIEQEYGYLSILINNAGIAADHHQPASELPTDDIRKDFDVNFFGLIDVTQTMLPLLKKAPSAKIINISSNMGSLGLATDPDSRFFKVSSMGYQASKAAVNFVTISLSKELRDENISVNSVNPGWTATEFGGRPLDSPKIPGMQSVEEGAARIVAIASDPDNSTTGTFTENAGTLPW